MTLFIHEAAKWLGTTPRAIRFYEEKGLIAPHKMPDNGYRLYSEPDLERLRWIIALRELGLSVQAVRETLAAASADRMDGGRMNSALPNAGHNIGQAAFPVMTAASDGQAASNRSGGSAARDHSAQAGGTGGSAAPGTTSPQTDNARLHVKLDEARQRLYREWSDLSLALQSLDRLLEGGLPVKELTLEQLEAAAEAIKETGALRNSWRDLWDYDSMAASYRGEAARLALEPLVSKKHYELVHAALFEWLDPAEGEQGLDLGAGTGNLTARFAGAGADMTAVEQSSAMLAVLRESLPDVDARQGNLLALPFRMPAFHLVSCAFALHHLTLRQQLVALEEIDRVLLPGGRLCLGGIFLEQAEPGISGSAPPPSPIGYPIGTDELAERLRSRGYRVILPVSDTPINIIFAQKAQLR